MVTRSVLASEDLGADAVSESKALLIRDGEVVSVEKSRKGRDED